MAQPMRREPQAVRGGHYSDYPAYKGAAGQRKRRQKVRRKERTEKDDDRMTGTSHQQLRPSTEQVSCLKKQTAAQAVQNVPAFYGTRKFITLSTTARHWTLISASIIQSRPSQPASSIFPDTTRYTRKSVSSCISTFYGVCLCRILQHGSFIACKACIHRDIS
jgi:hypothetical protein